MSPDEAIREFLVESHEGLDALRREFLALEAPDDLRPVRGRTFRRPG